MIDSRMIHDGSVGLEGKFFDSRRFLLGSISTVLQQVMMEVNLYRAGLGASAAKRAGIREVLPILRTAQVRGDHGANRSRIGRPVGVAADIAENRTDIQ